MNISILFPSSSSSSLTSSPSSPFSYSHIQLYLIHTRMNTCERRGSCAADTAIATAAAAAADTALCLQRYMNPPSLLLQYNTIFTPFHSTTTFSPSSSLYFILLLFLVFLFFFFFVPEFVFVLLFLLLFVFVFPHSRLVSA